MSEVPKYVEIIASRGETTTEYKRRIEQQQELRDKRSAEATRRREDAMELARVTRERLQATMKAFYLDDYLRRAVTKFGSIRDDKLGVVHNKKGGPKSVGADFGSLEGYVYGHEPDADKPEQPVVRYALVGNSLNYLSRRWGKRDFTYTLSRYAVILTEGEETSDELSVWHGELPDLVFSERVGRSAKFEKELKQAVKAQNSDVLGYDDYLEKHIVPSVVTESRPIMGTNEAMSELLTQIDAGLTVFAQKYYVPIAEQVAPFPEY